MVSPTSSASKSPKGKRNVDKRRDIFHDFARLYRFSGHGMYKYFVDGAPKGERGNVTFHLRRNFGETFDVGAFFYKNPDRKKFLAYIMHAASGSLFPKDTDLDLGELFNTGAKQNNYQVNEELIERLGCTKQDLHDLFSTLPSAHHASRAKETRPLVLEENGPREVMPRAATEAPEAPEEDDEPAIEAEILDDGDGETDYVAFAQDPPPPRPMAPEEHTRPCKRRKAFRPKHDLVVALEERNAEILALKSSLEELRAYLTKNGLEVPSV